MAKFRDFPGHNMLAHIDNTNRIIDDTQHQLTQGWQQAFSDMVTVLGGEWVRTAPTKNAESKCSFTPWISNVHLVFTQGGSQIIKFPKRQVGVLTLIDNGNSFKQYISVSGLELTLNVAVGDTLFGSLTPV